MGGKEESQGRGRRQGGSTGDWRKACGGSSQAQQRHVKEYHKDRVGKEEEGRVLEADHLAIAYY